VTPLLTSQLEALYADTDAAIAAANPRCDASGRCCRFKEYGHTLFISRIEADYLLARAPAWSGPVSADFCPFQVEGLCTARGPRPLGCRVYFCDPTWQERGEALTESGIRRLKAIADEHGLAWEYAPLVRFLREAAVGMEERADEVGTSAGRQAEGNGRIGLDVIAPSAT